jgi:hypothetical protein
MLEPQLFLYRESFTFYRIVGTACLYAGDFGGAYTYFQRAEQIKPGDTRVELGLAAVHLRRKESGEALRLWLSILDRDPNNRNAKRGLVLVRRTDDPTDYITLAEGGKLKKLFPRVGVSVPGWVPVSIAAGAVLALLALVGWPVLEQMIERRPPRAAPQEVRAPLPADLTTLSADARYTLSDDEMRELVSRIGDLFDDYRDNLARREVNRIILSNASPLIKERMRLLAGYFREPDFTNFQDNFSYEEIAAEPWLYDGCYVRWSGATTNIVIAEDAVRFLLLVGYTDSRILEGTVPVTAPGVVDVEPGSVELIGRVGVTSDEVELTATSIRRIVPRSAR